MIKRKNKTGLLASEMNGILAELTDEQKNEARRKFREAKEKTYDNVAKGKDERVNPDFSKEEREFISDEIDKATYNGKYSGRDKKDDVMPMISKLNKFVECVNNKLNSKYPGKYYSSYNINRISLLFSVYKAIHKYGNIFEVDLFASVDRNKDDNDTTLKNLITDINISISETKPKYADILKDCVKELEKSDGESAVEKEN